MKAEILYREPWRIPYRATKVMCSDGRRRSVRLAGHPDTFFSIPGSVTVRGKLIKGFIMSEDDDLFFVVDQDGKNGSVLPVKDAPEMREFYQRQWLIQESLAKAAKG